MGFDENHPVLYLYHIVGKELVIDRGLHVDHLRQVHKAKGLPPPVMAGAGYQPFSEAYLEAHAKERGVTYNKTVRPKLPDYNEPEGFAERRAKNKALHAEHVKGMK